MKEKQKNMERRKYEIAKQRWFKKKTCYKSLETRDREIEKYSESGRGKEKDMVTKSGN